MKAFVSLGSFALAWVPAVVLAQQPAACERVQYSADVLARFPNIRAACLDVINKDGKDYAVVKADLVRATARRMTIRVKRPDGSHSDPIGVNVAPNERLNVGGKPTAIQDIAIGQELTAYINVTDPGIALAPADETAPVEFTPVPATPEPAPAPEPAAAAAEMPKTATDLPLLGSIGVVLLALGAGFAFLRRRGRA
jgi:LPXTG-motif cell wall-anchored protein